MAKRILLVIGTIILLIALYFIIFIVRWNLLTNEMTPLETGKVLDDIISIRDSYANVFLIKDSASYIAIDGGRHSDIFLKELNKIGIDPAEIKAILLTHSDNDHAAALDVLTHVQVFLSKQEAQFLNGDKSRIFFIKNKIASDNYTVIEDQQIINIGNVKIKGILTPGHTPGLMCYQINDKYLFTGDLISLKSSRIEKIDALVNMDDEMAAKSVEIISNLPGVEYIFTAHYGYTNDYENVVKDFRKKR